MVAFLSESHGRIPVQMVLRADDREIGKFVERCQLSPIVHSVFSRDLVILLHFFPTMRFRLSNADYFQPRREV